MLLERVGVEKPIQINDISLCQESPVYFICRGADPFILRQGSKTHLLLQEDLIFERELDGLDGYTLRTCESLAELSLIQPSSLIVSSQDKLKQSWAAELHFSKYIYVAASDGNNINHRIHVYESLGDVNGPWKELGLLKTPEQDDSWAIDLTFAQIPYQGINKTYAIWSGWEGKYDEFPQHLYIAETISPTEIGPKNLIASPNDQWCKSVQSILEGPQALVINNQFKGLLVTGNASWTCDYETRVMVYNGGDPLMTNSWCFTSKPLFNSGYGIGHGMIIEENNDIFYCGHMKIDKKEGWEDRWVFYVKLNKEKFNKYLESF